MRRLLASFLSAAVLAAVALSAAAARAGPAEKSTLQASEFSGLYRTWTETSDPEQKIAIGEKLLALEPSLASWAEGTPREQVRGELVFAVGSAYVTRALGVRADNLEQGIGHLEKALPVFTREADPQSWAATHNNLGIAYWSRIRGERADNQEKAISHFEAALTVLTRESFTQQWAQAQNNLAVVYWNRIHGDRATNIETAISNFEAANTVFTKEGFPGAWASIQNNLGSAYQVRVKGERPANREQAITHIEAALTVFTREATPREWAQAENNLANAYLNRIGGEAADNLEKAITHLGNALSVFKPDAFPQEWAQSQRGIGQAYSDRIRGDKAANRAKAIAAYQSALTVFTRDADPRTHLSTARILGHLHLESGDLTKAAAAYASARDAFLLLSGESLDDTATRALIADAGPLFAEAAFTAVKRGDAAAALELADEGRARLLATALKRQSLELSPATRQKLAELHGAIRAAEQDAAAAHGTERAEALDRLAGLRRELLALVKNASGTNTASALSRARTAVTAGGAVAMPVVTRQGGKILIVTGAKDEKAPTVVDVPELTTQRLSDLLAGTDSGTMSGWLRAYFINYMQGEQFDREWPDWLAAIDALGPDLWRLFAGKLDAALQKLGVKPGTRLVWVPSGWLGTVPLGLAQDPASKRRLADGYEIAYVPSLAALAAAEAAIAKPSPATLTAIINPTGDLPGAEKEGSIVASYFAPASRTLLVRNAATPDAVLAALKGRTHWHFASHGTFSWSDVRQSALLMHGPTRLSVARLFDTEGLGHPRLVVLSACETGLIDITSNPDEFTGLPVAFTALGATGVLGTLWPVSDAATALLIAKFYELHMGAGLSPPTALSKAQAWLRAATNDELGAYARTAASQGRLESRQLAGIEAELSPEGLARSRNSALFKWLTPDNKAADGAKAAEAKRLTRPYEHPYYWGGFIHTGL
jgi:CHAT domain-containing protein